MKTKHYFSISPITRFLFWIYLIAFGAKTTSAQNEGIYWNDYFGNIQKSDLDGNNIQTIMSGLNAPETLVIDEEEEEMFFTLFNGSSPHIAKANLDGTGLTTILTAAGNSIQIGLGIDKENEKIYYPGGDGISRCNYDGSNNELLVANHPGAQDVAVDVEGGKVYWIDNIEHKVKRANMDGSNVEDLVTTDIIWTVEIDLDLKNDKIYWSDFSAQNIKRCDLDGGNVEIVVDENTIQGINRDLLTPTPFYPRGIYFDENQGILYFLNGMEYKVRGLDINTNELTDLTCLPPMTSGTSVIVIEVDPCQTDLIPPTARCQNGTIILGNSGEEDIQASQVDNGSSDNCDFTLAVNPAFVDCSNMGTVNITLTITDEAGNFDNCTAMWTIVDDAPPLALCQDITVEIEDGNSVTISDDEVNDNSLDNCDLNYSVSQNTFTCDQLFDNTITMTVTDAAGLSDNCTANVYVEDVVPPEALCKNITIELDELGGAFLNDEELDNGSTDNCSEDLGFIASETDFDCSHMGQNMVTLTVFDDFLNGAECTAVVTVVDKIPPTPKCENVSIELDIDGSNIFDAFEVDNGSEDNCDEDLDFESNVDFELDCNDIGSHSITVTVTDDSGNAATCNVTLQVLDIIPPDAFCEDITVSPGLDGLVVLEDFAIDNFSIDNCDELEATISPSVFSCDDIGDHVVTMTVTDPSGNSDDCSATVSIVDDLPPVVGCQDITIELGVLGEATIDFEDIDNGSEDNCSENLIYDISQTTFDCLDIGNNMVTLTVFDEYFNGLECNVTVTVVDNQPPEALCKNLTIDIENGHPIIILAEELDDGSFDICSDQLAVFPNNISVNCADVGDNTFTMIFMDESGNTATCQSIISIIDSDAPISECKDITVELTDLGVVLIDNDAIDASSADNCDGLDFSLSVNLFTCDEIGSHLVTMVVTDASGNFDQCSATVTIVDALPPLPVCKDITVSPGLDGTISITADDIDGGSEDNCEIMSKEISQADWDCNDIGNLETVFLTLTDASGNTSECFADVSIVDLVSPEAKCKDIEVNLDFFGVVDISADDINDSSVDNCDDFAVKLSTTALPFGCDDIGINNAELFVEDMSGNMASCIAKVTVRDNQAPEALCTDITVMLQADVYNLTAEEVNSFSFDNCEIASMSVAPSFFDCGNLGNNLVTLTLRDPSSNTSECTSNVQVVKAPPIALCKNVTLELDEDGFIPIVPEDVNGGSSASCEPPILSLNITAFDCADIGTKIVTLTANDGTQTDQCLATVTVEDNLPPAAICRDTFVVLDQNGIAIITPEMIDSNSWDNCSIDTIGLDINDFNQDNLGENTVVLGVVDLFENVDTCHAIVTVKMGVGVGDPDMNNTSGLSIFPNPVSNNLSIRYQNFEPNELLITDISGRILNRYTEPNIPQQINTSKLSKGVFLIILKDKVGNHQKRRFVKVE